MYAGTTVNWNEILVQNTPTVDESLPLFLCVFSSDKGPEKITDLTYDDFVKYYGQPDFYKYGQPLSQAHAILKAGGRVLGKRIVAENATLANIIIVANVTEVTEQKTNETGQPLYVDNSGHETTEVTETPANVTKAKIKYEAYTLETAKTVDEVDAHAATLKSENKFPLFTICDNGRGVSIKKIRIKPEYNASRRLSFMYYTLGCYENSTLVESKRFAILPKDVPLRGNITQNLFLNEHSCVQTITKYNDDVAEAFLKKISEITGYTILDLYGMDVLFGKELSQAPIPSIIIDEESISLNAEYGIPLLFGENANGDLGSAPFPGKKATDNWAKEAVKFFNGTFSDEIYDLDEHKIDFCLDANYPYNFEDETTDVKGAISKLAVFREDFYYFRDLGLGLNSIGSIEEIIANRGWIQSPFIADYESHYDIIDSNYRQITVTMTHGLAPLLVSHYKNNLASPVAGEYNGFVITEAVDGTLNIIPRVTPTYDQKQMLDDIKVNYVNYGSNGGLVVQSNYTSQDHDGPLSYINNVLITQHVVKAIRKYCPKIRFMLTDINSTDFSMYKSLIESNVINNYSSYFNSISLVYTADDEMTRSHVFNASLYCYYRNFAQAEIFDVFAVEGSPNDNNI